MVCITENVFSYVIKFLTYKINDLMSSFDFNEKNAKINILNVSAQNSQYDSLILISELIGNVFIELPSRYKFN